MRALAGSTTFGGADGGRRANGSIESKDAATAKMAAASAAGPVRHFTFEPPNLSEVFREAVGR